MGHVCMEQVLYVILMILVKFEALLKSYVTYVMKWVKTGFGIKPVILESTIPRVKRYMFLHGNEPKDIISKYGSFGVFSGNGSHFF